MKLKLLTPSQLKTKPKGTVLYTISGFRVVVGEDEIDDDTRYGFLAYGEENDVDFNWDTEN